ncbi:MAG: lysophospholipid acyltransferase family protein [Myxococcales bacterium]|nr:1-acyl-sn-glycerol-3-phosphate acyltransferase [Polyangiaceae bacterium]MDW8248078.1 lysophospholipid acyltransferase family protein [Myxococcales bacterium]
MIPSSWAPPHPGVLVLHRALRLAGQIAAGSLRGFVSAHADALGRARSLQEQLRKLMEIHGIQTSVEGVPPDGPSVVVCNHLSYLDPVIVGSLLPCAPIAKEELGGWPGFGSAARSFGVIFVRRGDPWSGARALLRAARVLRQGVSVLAFPEGTTTSGEVVLRFRWGVFGLARRLGVPVVPVRLDFEDTTLAWVGRQLFLPHYLRTAARPTSRVRVRFLDPMFPRPHDEPRLLAAHARQLIFRAR